MSFNVHHGQYPYRYVTVEGTVVSVESRPSAAAVVKIASRYLPERDAAGFAAAELSRPDSALVLFTVRPDRWLGFDFGED